MSNMNVDVLSVPDREGLHATESTRTALGPQVMEGLTAAVPPGQAVVITGTHDFNSASNAIGQALADIFQQVGMNPYEGVSMGVAMIMAQQHHKMGFAATTDALANDPAPLIPIIGEESALSIVNGPGRVPDDTCVLAIRTDDQVGHFLERIYGATRMSVQDLQLYMGYHELDHCRNLADPFSEYRSDAAANSLYAADIAANRAGDPEMPYYFRSVRATLTMLGAAGADYVTGGIAPLAGEQPLTEQQLAVAEAQIQQAAMLPQRSLLERNVEIPELDDPLYGQLIYEETRRLLQQGSFDDLPYGRAVAERFIDGAQRYGQEHFNVAPEDRIDTPAAASQRIVPGSSPDPAAARQRYGMEMSP